jgi:hypothetical protein
MGTIKRIELLNRDNLEGVTLLFPHWGALPYRVPIIRERNTSHVIS